MNLSPGMQQYMKVKNEHPDCLVLFRMGDFYETFYEDAKTAAKELNIVLTARGKGEKRAPLAGIPFHAIEPYIAKLIKKGYKVALVEQMEDPRFAKGLVKRDLVRIITPGTVLESSLLNEKQNNYVMSVASEKDEYGIALADISTGEFLTSQFKGNSRLNTEVAKFSPAEIIIPLSMEESELSKELKKSSIVHTFDDRHFWLQKAHSILKDHFEVHSLDGFGCEQLPLSISASGALLSYLKETQKTHLNYINSLHTFSTDEFMMLDSVTQRNLELLKNIRDGTSRGTLLEALDATSTSMGSRLLRKWIVRPLLSADEIQKRLDAVEELFDNIILREELKEQLVNVQDVERLISRVTFGSANARDLVGLKFSLEHVPKLKQLLQSVQSSVLSELRDVSDQKEVVELIQKAIKDEPSAILRDGNLIKKGYSKELDELHEITKSGKSWVSELEGKERQKTGIKSLKIKYNQVFGYFIEVTKANLHLVPPYYVRKQTQVNAERFITDELKEKESMILGAEEKIVNLEYELFLGVIKEVSKKTSEIQDIARKIAQLDCILSLAHVASHNNYAKPKIDTSDSIVIRDGRHPVVERFENCSFVANDCELDTDKKLLIVTGPNMVGKSTWMRQVALIVLMAQVGSFVPARAASIGLVDRIFTRVGAYDDLTMGQSTFMVEMSETANILNNATNKSLIILDELGRGTSTYDGVSLAWAIAEHIHNAIGAKTLFATHYHQLNKLEEKFPGIKNYHITVKDVDDKIVFLRKIERGGTDKSYGIHVAKLAGVPHDVIERSKSIMSMLEMEDEIGARLHNGLKKEKKTKKEAQENQEFQKSLLDMIKKIR
jgi:DNA mismatch repair protein MutS